MRDNESNHQMSPIELRSEEIDEILGKSPSSLISWGITIILLIILILLGVSWFIHYPDAMKAEITLYSENMPVSLQAKTGGKIVNVFVNPEQDVKSGSPLMLIENPAVYQDIIALEFLLDSIMPFYQQNLLDKINISAQPAWVLGDLQPVYAGFDKAVRDYYRFNKLGLIAKKCRSLQQQKTMTHLYYNRLYAQRNLLESDLELASREYNRDSALFKKEVIAAADFEKKQSAFLQKKYSFEGSRTILASTQIQLAQLDQQFAELQLQQEEQSQLLLMALKQSIEALQNQLGLWKQTYLITAPIDGKVVFTKFWSTNQQVAAGDKVVNVVPSGKGKISGRLQLPLEGAGKVKPGQKVLIRVNDYPYMEYGLVEGKVENISSVPDDKTWALVIKMPNGLKTTYLKELSFKSGMTGQAEIITEDIRLLERFFNPVKALIKGRM